MVRMASRSRSLQVRHFTRDVTVSCIRVGNERVCLFGTPVSSFSLCVPGRRRTNNKQWHAAATPTHAQPAHTYPSEREEGVLLLLVERRPEFGEAELLLLVLLVPLPTGPTAQAAAHGWRCWSLRRGQQYPETRLLSLSPPPPLQPTLCCCRRSCSMRTERGNETGPPRAARLCVVISEMMPRPVVLAGRRPPCPSSCRSALAST